MQGEGILFPCFASHDPHNPPRISIWIEEAARRIQKVLGDQSIDHEYLLEKAIYK